MWCWMNGEFIRAEDLKISPFDHGFLYGAGFFETFRTYDGNVFLFQEHMDRLNARFRNIELRCLIKNAEILAAVKNLMNQSGG